VGGELEAEVKRLRAQHDEYCDALELSPMLGPSQKPCNCRVARECRIEVASGDVNEEG